MSGMFSASGLITGLDSSSIIEQLMLIEHQPIFRMEDQIAALETQQEAVRNIRTQLLTLRNLVQDFRLSNVFGDFATTSSEDTVLTAEASSSNPVTGSFEVDVIQLASATVALSGTTLGAAINPDAALNSSGISTTIQSGTFTINGVEMTVDPDTQSLNQILGVINSSGTGITGTYDAATDKVTFENSTAGNTAIINFGASDDTSNLLSVLGLTEATQSTNTNGSTEVTSTGRLGAIDPSANLNTVNLAGGAITSESFTINGITISVDPTTDSLSDVIGRINASDAGVTASYDATTDGLRIVSKTLGSRTVNFGSGGTNNFLAVTGLTSAVQTAGKDSQFTVNGGAVQTRNTNEITDAIAGVTVRLLSTGSSTVTVNSDDDAIIEHVNEFITAFNDSVDLLRNLTGVNGDLHGDSGISAIESYLRNNVFSQVTGLSTSFSSVLNIGISTGDDFDASASAHLELDEEAFREALRDDRQGVQNLFANDDETGVADVLFAYLEDTTKVTGFLNVRAKSNGTIDQQIQSINDRIERMEQRLTVREDRLRRQFTNLETMSSSFQSQASALSALSAF